VHAEATVWAKIKTIGTTTGNSLLRFRVGRNITLHLTARPRNLTKKRAHGRGRSDYKEFNLEIGGRLPLTEHLKNSLLGIFVLHGRTLRAFEPADHFIVLLLIVLVDSTTAITFRRSGPMISRR